jgi:dihydropteroate synthase
MGIYQGCHIMRVHDVLAMKRVALMMDTIIEHKGGAGHWTKS